MSDGEKVQTRESAASLASAGSHEDHVFNRIGKRLRAEIRGVERVPEDQRVDTSKLSPLTMFLSPNMSIAALSTGALGPALFGLDFWTCVLCAVIWLVIGALPVGLFAVFGARFGLRQQILSRYLTGNVMGRIFAIFNVISCIGWNGINLIPAVQLLASMGPLPPWAGCLIFVVITCAVALAGYRVIHLYERYSWIPNFAVYLVVIARLKMTHTFTFGLFLQLSAGNVLSFVATIFGFVAGWVPSSADYFVYMPSDTPGYQIFFGMLLGLAVPSMFTLILGAACATATMSSPEYLAAYETGSIGGLMYHILVVNNLHGFGKFCCVILALSAIANNVPGSYSLALAAQAVWSPLARFPRLGWCLIGNFVSLGLAIPAYYVFAAAMSNFLSIVGYNVSIYIGISMAEHWIYRRGFAGYDVSDFENRKTLPVGIAGIVGFLFGVASTVLSMDQTWYAGVIARKIEGDISFELNIAFAFIGYNLVRPLEIKYFGR